MPVEFLTSDVKFYTVSHIYDENCYTNNEFLIGVITSTNTIKIIKILYGKKHSEFVIDIYSFLPQKLKKNFQHVSVDKLDVIYLQSMSNYYTLFLKLTLLNKQYVYQVNVYGEMILEFKPIPKFYETPKVYLGYSDTFPLVST